MFFFQEILQHKDAKQLINESDLYENTPLHVAAMYGYALIAEVSCKGPVVSETDFHYMYLQYNN